MAYKPVNVLDPNITASKTILLLAWPTIAEQILQIMVSYVDTAMVGSMGANATASIAINNSFINLVNGLMNAAALGFGVQMARRLGEGRPEKARQVIRQGLLVMLMAGLGLTLAIQLAADRVPAWMGGSPAILAHAAAYLRIVMSASLMSMSVIFCGTMLRFAGDTKTPLLYNILTNLLNVAGNYFLIFQPRTIHIMGYSFHVWGAGMGVEGAALATAAATAFSGLMLLRALFSNAFPLKVSLKGDFSLDPDILHYAWHLGAPAAYERLILSSGQILMTRLVAGLGTASLAAYHLANTAESISYMPGYGLAVAATTLVAQSLGAEKPLLAWQYAKRSTQYGVGSMAFAGLMMFLFSRQLMMIFTPDPQVIALGAIGLKIMAFSEPFFALAIVISGVLRGAGDTKRPFYYTSMGMWGVRVGTVILLCYVLKIGVYGAWVGMILDLMVRGLLSLRRFLGGQWMETEKK
jgi:putative MATE family efflux protein